MGLPGEAPDHAGVPAERLAAWLHARLHFFEGMHELIRRFYLAIEGKGEMPIPMSEAVRTTRIIDDIFAECERHQEES